MSTDVVNAFETHPGQTGAEYPVDRLAMARSWTGEAVSAPLCDGSGGDSNVTTAIPTSGRWKRLGEEFGIGRAELDRLGLAQTHFLRLPLSVVAASIALNVLGMAVPLGILQVYDRIIPHASTETLTALVAALLGVVVAEALLRISRGYLTAWAAARFIQVSLVDAYERILYAPRQELARLSTARLLQMLMSVQRLGDFFGGRSRLLLLDMPFLVVFLAMIALIGGWLVFVAVAVLVMFAVATLRLGKSLKSLLEARDQQDSKIYDFISDSLGGITTLKGLAMEAVMLRRFERLQAGAAEIDYKSIEGALLAESTVTALGNVTTVAMVTFGAILAVHGHLTIGTLSACTLLSGRVIQPILGAASLWNEVQKMRLGLENVEQVFAMPAPPDLRRRSEQAEAQHAPGLDLDDVGLETEGRHVLHGITVRLAPGRTAMIEGRDGAGRSALLKIITGESQATSGSVTIDGMPADAFHTLRLGTTVFVPQSPAFFRGTILENLMLFGQGPSAEDAKRAVLMVGLDVEVDRLPQGFDTRLGEGISETLPLGFLKRLSIARALALKPRLLVLEEPQSFLDTEADRRVLACLHQLSGFVTVLFVSSRPSYAAVADEVWRLEEGRLVDVVRKPTPEGRA